MNKEELFKWMHDAILIRGESEYDHHGNKSVYQIYKRDDKLYRVGFLNGNPNPVFGKHGWEEGNYQPQEVVEVKEMVEVTKYVPKG